MLIGITGKMKAGKDTAGLIIKDILDKQINKVSKIRRIAFPIKQMTAVLLGCTTTDLESQKFKAAPLPSMWNNKLGLKMTPRKILQQLGTEFGRDVINEDIWINLLLSKYLLHKEEIWLICDVRYPNEINAIQKAGGILIEIKSSLRGENSTHRSEKALELPHNCQYTISNNGTKVELRNQLISVLRKENIIK